MKNGKYTQAKIKEKSLKKTKHTSISSFIRQHGTNENCLSLSGEKTHVQLHSKLKVNLQCLSKINGTATVCNERQQKKIQLKQARNKNSTVNFHGNMATIPVLAFFTYGKCLPNKRCPLFSHSHALSLLFFSHQFTMVTLANLDRELNVKIEGKKLQNKHTKRTAPDSHHFNNSSTCKKKPSTKCIHALTL